MPDKQIQPPADPAPKPGGASPPVPAPLLGLILWTVVDLAIVLIVTVAACAIHGSLMADDSEYHCYRWMQALGVQPRYVGLGDRYEKAANRWRLDDYRKCKVVPPDDAQLDAWLAQRQDIKYPVVRRHPRYVGDQLLTEINVSYSADKGHGALPIPWETLGYEGDPNDGTWVHEEAPPDAAHLPPDGEFRLGFLGWMQLGLLVAGLFRTFRYRNRPIPLPTGRTRLSEFWAGVIGAGFGLAGGGIYWLYDQALLHWGGASVHGWASWRTSVSMGWNGPHDHWPAGWNNVTPHQGVLVALFIIVIAGPIVQETFFRGGLQHMWSCGGRPWLGITLASVFGSLIFLDLTYLPFSLLMGFALGWLYQRSDSILGPLLAHLISYALVLCVIFGAIPSLPHPANMLPGHWAPQPTQVTESLTVWPTTPLEFDRGGQVKEPVYSFREGEHEHNFPRRYDWVNGDTIRIRYHRAWYAPGSRILHSETVYHDYKVSVNNSELVLTPLVDGQPQPISWRYRRYFP